MKELVSKIVTSVREYDFKPLLEVFYGVGAAAVVATVLFVRENNPFDADPVDFNTFEEWRTWALLAVTAGGRAAWLAASAATVKVTDLILAAVQGEDRTL